MSCINYKELKKHEGHKIVCVSYKCQMPNGKKVYNVALECETCNKTLLDYDKDVNKNENFIRRN